MMELYLACRAEVMLTLNLWADVGLHNGAKGKVVDVVYKYQMDQDRQIEWAFVCLKIHFEQMLQLHIFFFIDHCSFVNKNLF